MSDERYGRPEWISREDFRDWHGASSLDRMLRVGNSTATSFVYKCERDGRPIRKAKRGVKGGNAWRPIDVVARARAESQVVMPPLDPGASCGSELVPVPEGFLPMLSIAQRHKPVAPKEFEVALSDRRMATKESILNGAVSVDVLLDTCGVYFLIRGAEIVYVGQSVSVMSRLSQHLRGGKDFDRFAFVPVEKKNLNVVEWAYINIFRPALNKKFGLSTTELGAVE